MAILVATAAVFASFVLLHSSFYTCINNSAYDYREDHSVYGQKSAPGVPVFFGYAACAAKIARHDSDAITAIATALLAIITLGLVFLGIEQSKTTRAQLRAYLSVVIGGGAYQDVNLRFEGAPTIKNNGQTPAYKVRSWISADIISTNLVETYDFDRARPADLGESQATIGPGETRIIRGVVENRVPDGDVAMIKEGVRVSLWVWGEIHYEDCFGDPHLTRFSQRLFWDRMDNIIGQYGVRFAHTD